MNKENVISNSNDTAVIWIKIKIKKKDSNDLISSGNQFFSFEFI
jgi:hypothetical protein